MYRKSITTVLTTFWHLVVVFPEKPASLYSSDRCTCLEMLLWLCHNLLASTGRLLLVGYQVLDWETVNPAFYLDIFSCIDNTLWCILILNCTNGYMRKDDIWLKKWFTPGIPASWIYCRCILTVHLIINVHSTFRCWLHRTTERGLCLSLSCNWSVEVPL